MSTVIPIWGVYSTRNERGMERIKREYRNIYRVYITNINHPFERICTRVFDIFTMKKKIVFSVYIIRILYGYILI